MADDIDWLSVLRKVFEKYGTQLHRNQVKKFAARVARKQGRTEDKKHLQKGFKSFLQTEAGRRNVTAKDDMLSLHVPAPLHAQSVAQASAQPPAQARLSLFDLAEAAATLSTASRQPAPAVPKGQRSARKSKGDSSSPDAEAGATAGARATPGAASSDGMQTRGRATRRPSVEKQPGGKSVLPPKPKAEPKAEPKATKAQRQPPQPSRAQTAGAAKQDVSPGVCRSENAAQMLAGGPSGSDAYVPGPSEEGPSAAALSRPASKDSKLPHAGEAPDTTQQTNLEPGLAAGQPSTTLAEAPETAKQKKPKKQSLPTAAAAGSGRADDVGLAKGALLDRMPASEEVPGPSATEQDARAPPAFQAEQAKLKKQRRKHKADADDSSQPEALESAAAAATAGDDFLATEQQDKFGHQTSTSAAAGTSAAATLTAAAPLQAADQPAAEGTAAVQPETRDSKKKMKKKRKHGGDEDGVVEAHAAPSPAATAAAQASAAAPVSEAMQEQAADDALVDAAPKLKKKKHKHSEVASASKQSAATSPTADEAAVGDPAVSQANPGIKLKKKTKKRRHSEAAAQASPSAPLASEAGPSEAGPSAATAAEASTAQRNAAAAVKPKKRKLKHSNAQTAPSSTHLNDASSDAAAVEPASEPKQHTAAAAGHASVHPEEPALKPKRKRKSKGSDTEAPAEEAAEVAAAEAGVAPAEEATAEPARPASAQKAKGRQSKAARAAEKASISAGALQSSWRENAKRQDVKKGKFTKLEKDTLKQAAIAYAQEHSLPTADLTWLFSTRSRTSEHKDQARGAWHTISESLPHRTYKAVYACGTRMLHERNYQGKWSKEEDEQLRQLVAEKGSKWAEISRSLNRLPEGCRDRWRELRLGDAKLNGRWSEDETGRLRSLVEAYMTQKQANEEERSSGGGGLSLTLNDLESGPAEPGHTQSDGRIILDDIDWDLVSEQHGTRSAAQCLTKWYTQLAPSMVTKGEWGSGDDRRLLRALLKTGATEDFQVDWGQLVLTRTAQQARRRWRLMLKCLKDANDQEFSENLKQLVTAFTPDLLPSPHTPAKARTSKKSKGVADPAAAAAAAAAAADYPGMSGGMY